MSTDAQPPSPQPQEESLTPRPTIRKPSLFQKLARTKQPPPTAFETQAKARRSHQRSSSFGGFVRRILPSNHEEKGHTLRHSLRKQYEDDGAHAAVDLVFGVSDDKGAEVSQGVEVVQSALGPKGDAGDHFQSRGRPPTQPMATLDQTSDGSGHKATFPRGTSRLALGDESYFRTASWGRYGGGSGARVNEPDGDRHHARQHVQEHADSHIPLSDIDMPGPENIDMTKTQQMFVNKKAKRHQRRSLKESGDFLGVQGANPRTGLWDVSSGTSSSGPSQVSEETKRKLDEEARKLEEKKRQYEEAQAKHSAELRRVQSLRDARKEKKDLQKRLELRAKQRKHGLWKLGEQGWSSVAEPDLSPIVQSLAGSPSQETAPADRLFPMPCAADPTPYANPYKTIGPKDYFGHRVVSSPLAKERSSVEVPARSQSIARKPVASPVHQRSNHSSSTIIHGSPIKNSPYPGEISQSSPDLVDPFPRVGVEVALDASPSQKLDSFLDQLLPVEPEEHQEKRATAISYQSISMSQVKNLQQSDQSAKDASPGKGYTCLKELPPVSLKDPFMARIPSNSQPILPPTWAPPSILDSSKRRMTPTFTSTITTTGYDHLQPLLIQFDGSSDSPPKSPSLNHNLSRIPLRTSSHQNSRHHTMQSTEYPTNPADIATSSEHLLQQTKQRSMRLCHTISAGSEAPIQRTPISTSTFPKTLRQPGQASPEAHTAALTAFQNLRHRVAMRKAGSREREDSLTPPKLRKGNMETKDISPRAKRALGGPGGIGNPLHRTGKNISPGLYERRLLTAVTTGSPGQRREDSLVIWHPAPNTENRNSRVLTNTGEVMELVCVSRQGASPAKKPAVEKRAEVLRVLNGHHNKGVSPVQGGCPQRGVSGVSGMRGQVVSMPSTLSSILNSSSALQKPKPKPDDSQSVHFKPDPKRGVSNNRRTSPKSATPQSARVHIGDAAYAMGQTAWWIVEPVFHPESAVRKRWEKGEITWTDMGVFVAAGVFVVIVLLAMGLAIRVLLVLVQIVRTFGSVWKFLTGF